MPRFTVKGKKTRYYKKSNKKFVTQGYRSRKMGTVKYKNSRVNKSMVRLGLGLPKKVCVTHRYSTAVTLTSTAGVIGVQRFSCNGMFDPDITNVGHQPLYFDQFTALYDHYTVIGSKITVKVAPTASGDEPCQIALFLNDDTTLTPTDVNGVGEQSSGKIKLIAPNSNNVMTLTKKWSAKKTFGGSILGNDNLQGTSAANPTEQTYYDIVLQSVTGGVTTACVLQCFIEYIAIWDELKDIAQS